MKVKRKILKIDEDLCNGCGQCVTDCAEGAIRIVDGKAKIIKESFCDGLGACIGSCPTGALEIVEKEAHEFTGPNPDIQNIHTEDKKNSQKHNVPCGCPSSKPISLKKSAYNKPADIYSVQAIASELEQWPVQLHLVSPGSTFFKNKELVILSTCGPVSSADVHWKYLRGRSVVVACPKLDNTSPYASKLAEIFKEKTINKAIIVRMEVPCCSGLTAIAREALSMSGRVDLVLEEHTLSLNGELKKTGK